MLCDKMEISEAIRKAYINGELVELKESGRVQIIGAFGNSADLLEFIYNDIMANESPGYVDFMKSLDSAIIVND